MASPNVGDEWSSDTTTTRPFASVLTWTGGCQATAQKAATNGSMAKEGSSYFLSCRCRTRLPVSGAGLSCARADGAAIFSGAGRSPFAARSDEENQSAKKTTRFTRGKLPPRRRKHKFREGLGEAAAGLVATERHPPVAAERLVALDVELHAP